MALLDSAISIELPWVPGTELAEAWTAPEADGRLDEPIV